MINMEGKKYIAFLKLLEEENKDLALMFIIDLLQNNQSLKDIYEDYLIPSLKEYECNQTDEEICVWKEHTRTSIIRTIIEATYQYVIKERKSSIDKSVIVLCPQEEYHEVGALIATNYFILTGFDAKFIGANTPSDNIISALRILKPDYIALSVTDYYNIVVTKKLTEKIKDMFPETKIIIGGQAFSHKDALKQVTYNYILQTRKDIFDFAKEVAK